jgi:hypothetical protein
MPALGASVNVEDFRLLPEPCPVDRLPFAFPVTSGGSALARGDGGTGFCTVLRGPVPQSRVTRDCSDSGSQNQGARIFLTIRYRSAQARACRHRTAHRGTEPLIRDTEWSTPRRLVAPCNVCLWSMSQRPQAYRFPPVCPSDRRVGPGWYPGVSRPGGLSVCPLFLLGGPRLYQINSSPPESFAR